jgi:hypothetical protein
MSDQSIIEGKFGQSPRYAVLLWHQSSGDVLSATVLAELLKFEADVDAIAVGTDTYSTLCKIESPAPGSPCMHRSVLDYWHHNSSLLKQGVRKGLHSFVNSNTTSATGVPIDQASILGEVQRDGAGKLVKARTLKSSWLLSPESVHLEKVKAWELEFEALADQFRTDQFGGANLVFVTTDSLERGTFLLGSLRHVCVI